MNTDEIHIAILLATYNGEKYLREQMESLLTQKKVTTKIYIHDDFSTDGTKKIIEQVSSQFPNRVIMINSSHSLGVVKSYQFLLDNVDADFYLFSDQDDVWDENKVSEEIFLLKQFEGIPSLVYSDLEIVDSKLNVLSQSMFRSMNVINTDKTAMLLTQNVITGNTVAFNKALRNLIVNHFRMDDGLILMHDGWLGLVSSIYGKIFFLSRPTVKYRQHESNVVGARKNKIDKLLHIEHLKQAVINTILQGRALNKKMSLFTDSTLSFSQRQKAEQLVSSYAMLPKCSTFDKLNIMRKYSFRKQGLLRNVLFVLIVLNIKDRIND